MTMVRFSLTLEAMKRRKANLPGMSSPLVGSSMSTRGVLQASAKLMNTFLR